MKIKIVGFRVNMTRPTYNRTIEIGDVNLGDLAQHDEKLIAETIYRALWKSDFLSVKRVDECLPTT